MDAGPILQQPGRRYLAGGLAVEAALGVLTLHTARGARLAHAQRHVLEAGRGTPRHTRPLLGQVAAL